MNILLPGKNSVHSIISTEISIQTFSNFFPILTQQKIPITLEPY